MLSAKQKELHTQNVAALCFYFDCGTVSCDLIVQLYIKDTLCIIWQSVDIRIEVFESWWDDSHASEKSFTVSIP